MAQYIINLSDAEDKALSYAAISQDEWLQNFSHHRCAVAIDEIVGIAVQKCLQNGMQIPASKDEIVQLAFAQGWVKTAAQVKAEADAEAAARAQAEAEAAAQQGA